MHPIKKLLLARQQGTHVGIASYCSANMLVIETALARAQRFHRPTLIEATANQVNQYGGYTGLTPAQFYERVMSTADRLGVNRSLVILGGDHLGPLTWRNENEAEAMVKAEELVYQYVKAGFTKIHLDTSMTLADDGEVLSLATIAQRGVRLYRKALEAYEALKVQHPDAVRPVFVIGSEVPIPGGARSEENGLCVTSPEALRETYAAYHTCFCQQGLPKAMEDVVAIVVQPGVEFGDDQVFLYNREKAAPLCEAMRDYPGLCLEGHSTDYQGARQLKEMCEDGIAILKVGPALTFALRESYYALSLMEEELVPEAEQSHFVQVLESAMLRHPQDWVNHYHGSEARQHIARKYSLSDRSRYYIGMPEVEASIHTLVDNLRKYKIPMGMLHQYMPEAFALVQEGRMTADSVALAACGIERCMDDYDRATS